MRQHTRESATAGLGESLTEGTDMHWIRLKVAKLPDSGDL